MVHRTLARSLTRDIPCSLYSCRYYCRDTVLILHSASYRILTLASRIHALPGRSNFPERFPLNGCSLIVYQFPFARFAAGCWKLSTLHRWTSTSFVITNKSRVLNNRVEVYPLSGPGKSDARHFPLLYIAERSSKYRNWYSKPANPIFAIKDTPKEFNMNRTYLFLYIFESLKMQKSLFPKYIILKSAVLRRF